MNWQRVDFDEWSPVDPMPVLYAETQERGRLKLIKRRRFIDHVELYAPEKHAGRRPLYALMPHFYTCEVLKTQRRAWANHGRPRH